MENEGKAAILAAALRVVARAGLAAAAEFGGPAERQGIAGDRFGTARFGGGPALGGRAETRWWTALIGLGLSGC